VLKHLGAAGAGNQQQQQRIVQAGVAFTITAFATPAFTGARKVSTDNNTPDGPLGSPEAAAGPAKGGSGSKASWRRRHLSQARGWIGLDWSRQGALDRQDSRSSPTINKDLRHTLKSAWPWAIRIFELDSTMSKESLEALLAKLKDDEGLQQNLKNATNLDDAVAIAQGAGFDISKYDFLGHKRLIGPHLLWEWDWI
jgi:predicted ribosomally synthesized peptide with nif11-like leader